MPRKRLNKFAWQTTRVMLFALLIGTSTALSGCQTMASVATEPTMCTVFKPIYWSKDDTLDTAKQVREHNAAWKAVC